MIFYNKDVNTDEKTILKKNIKKTKYVYEINVLKENIYNSCSLNLDLKNIEKEHNLNIKMDSKQYVKICGVVKNLDGELLSRKKVVVYQCQLINYTTEYIPICTLRTNNNGYYEMLLNDSRSENHYVLEILDD
ncbi:MAG: hypothetical protein ACRDAU_07210 [Clostridium sp.]